MLIQDVVWFYHPAFIGKGAVFHKKEIPLSCRAFERTGGDTSDRRKILLKGGMNIVKSKMSALPSARFNLKYKYPYFSHHYSKEGGEP